MKSATTPEVTLPVFHLAGEDFDAFVFPRDAYKTEVKLKARKMSMPDYLHDELLSALVVGGVRAKQLNTLLPEPVSNRRLGNWLKKHHPAECQ